MSKHNQQMTEHEYDGIRELDNQLPRWWILLFYITIAFAPIYMFYYHFSGKADLPVAKWEKQEDAHAAMQAEKEARLRMEAERMAKEDPDSLSRVQVRHSHDQAVIEKGKQIYNTHCFACHTETGGGLVGPNLTDDYWIHGATFSDSIRTVTEGVPEKGMIAWNALLTPADIEAVCSYLYTLRGTNPEGAKAPEGVQVPGSDDPHYLEAEEGY